MDGANIERISKALADETRLLIFKAIANNKEINCSKIADPTQSNAGDGFASR